jgi:hypothetical protein
MMSMQAALQHHLDEVSMHLCAVHVLYRRVKFATVGICKLVKSVANLPIGIYRFYKSCIRFSKLRRFVAIAKLKVCKIIASDTVMIMLAGGAAGRSDTCEQQAGGGHGS